MYATLSEREELWSAILTAIKKTIEDDRVYEAFFSGSSIAEVNGDTMVISAPSALAAVVFSTKFLKQITDAEPITNWISSRRISFLAMETLSQNLIPKFIFLKTPDWTLASPSIPSLLATVIWRRDKPHF